MASAAEVSAGGLRLICNQELVQGCAIELVIHGQVVWRFSSADGRDVYGVQFTDVDGYQRKEIARLTHAVQLDKATDAITAGTKERSLL